MGWEGEESIRQLEVLDVDEVNDTLAKAVSQE